jgi:high-affinity nickel-transport protein
MPNAFLRSFNDNDASLTRKIITIGTLLVAANVAAWAWALLAFHDHPLLLGTAVLAYSFGLRHAVDADHIAAIDNVTRKLMQEGKRPLTTGLFFSLGHSTVVILATIGVVLTAAAFKDQLESFHTVGSMIGTSVAAVFLLIIAAINVVILLNVYRAFRRVKQNGAFVPEDLDLMTAKGGLLARMFHRLFRMIRQSWHMYPLGFLFGLGFDTASEIGLLGISAAQATKGLSLWSILVFPALFTAGMSLIDTIDGLVMVGAYGWAFAKPIRKLYYNMTITFVSVLVALLIGGVETLGLIADRFGLEGGLWSLVNALTENFGLIGYFIIGLFLVSWAVSAVLYRLNRYDEIDVRAG